MIEAPARSPILLTSEKAASYLGMSETMLFRLMREGEIPAVRIGRKFTRFAVSDLDEYVAQLERTV